MTVRGCLVPTVSAAACQSWKAAIVPGHRVRTSSLLTHVLPQLSCTSHRCPSHCKGALGQQASASFTAISSWEGLHLPIWEWDLELYKPGLHMIFRERKWRTRSIANDRQKPQSCVSSIFFLPGIFSIIALDTYPGKHFWDYIICKYCE